MPKKASIVIGRFQPFHKGHLHLLDHATRDCDLLVVVLGSAGKPADIKNPFTDNDRAAMFGAVLHTEEIFKNRSFLTKYVSAHDYLYSEPSNIKWIQEVRSKVIPEVEGYDIQLYGHRSDDSSNYLDDFPDWELNETEHLGNALHATDIRESLFKHKKIPEDSLPEAIERFIRQWMESHAFTRLRAEWNLVAKQKRAWSKAPYPVAAITADSVVIHKGRVLMVTRGAHPGRGLMALPGGHFNVRDDIDLLDCALRELREETDLVLKRSECKTPANQPYQFAHKDRSVRGRIITHAFLWVLDEATYPMPKVIGGDDADEAFWVPLEDLARKSHLIFEDHLEIITAMVGTI